jgi:hypothetical protein
VKVLLANQTRRPSCDKEGRNPTAERGFAGAPCGPSAKSTSSSSGGKSALRIARNPWATALTGEHPPTDDDHDTVIRYFNLCAEEFFYYSHGYIHPQAWTSWLKGMEELLRSPGILDIWRQEFKKGSYYGLEAQAPFSLLPRRAQDGR